MILGVKIRDCGREQKTLQKSIRVQIRWQEPQKHKCGLVQILKFPNQFSIWLVMRKSNAICV